MKVTIEPWTPFHESLCWMLHDAYWAQRGLAAWQAGEVPHDATTNFGLATQHARLLVDQLVAAGVAEEGADAPIWLLEVGAGQGGFAANLLRALATTCGAIGRALAPRVRLVLSDFARRSVEEACATEALREHAAAGRVLPALLDLRVGGPPRGFDGVPLEQRFHAVFANYVCCVIPQRSLQRRPDGWYEQLVEVAMELPADPVRAKNPLRDLFSDPTRPELLKGLELRFAWRPRGLAELLTEPVHRGAVERLIDGLEQATVGYPQGFLDFVRGLAPRLAPGGAVYVTDYGKVEAAELAVLTDRKPQVYGNSLAHETPFPVFEAFAAAAGWAALRTRDPLRSVQTAVLAPDHGLIERLRPSFERHQVDCRLGDDLMDYYDTGRRASSEDEHDRAVRYFVRCVEIDPYSAEYRYRLAESAVDGGFYTLARAAAEVGMALEDGDRHDFEFVLGRAFCLDDDFSEAIAWYERSLVRDEHWVTHTNLATLYEHEGRFDDARKGYLRALELKPDYEKARRRLADLSSRIH